MSSQADGDLGQNVVICYFPWVPYYLRYQIGIDIIIDPPEAHTDPSVVGESQRLVHVELFFPDGFMCNPATFGGMPHPPSFGSGPPHFFPPPPYFFPPPPHFFPPMFPDFPHLTPQFHHNVQMGFQGPMRWQEQPHSRVFVYVGNSQPGAFMVIDGTPYGLIHPATSGLTGQRDTSRASAHTATERFIYNPAPFGGIPHPPLFGSGAPHFFPPQPPPMYPDFPHVDPQFDHHVPLGFEGPMTWQEQHDTPMFANGGNSQQEELMVNEDTPHFIIPEFNMRGEVLREQENIHDNPSQNMPSQQPRKQPGRSSQHPSASGITGQRGTSHASPRTANRRFVTYQKSRL